MNDSYVIDENVLRNAWHGKKPDKSDAIAEQKFLRDIFYGNQHVEVSEKILEKFLKFVKKAEKISKNVDNLVIPTFLKLIHNSSRVTYHTPNKINFKGIKKCDKEFVGVALKSNAVLVTDDSKLKTAIAKDKHVSNCKCATVEEILENNHA